MREADGERWYTIAEVAEMFGVTPYRISHHWLPNLGRFPNARKEFRQWWIPESDVRTCANNLPVKKPPHTRRPRKQDAHFRRLGNNGS